MNGIGGPVPPERSHRAIAVTDVTVDTMDGRGTLSGQTVVIEDGRISRMGRVIDVPPAESTERERGSVEGRICPPAGMSHSYALASGQE